MLPTRQWTHQLAHLRSRVTKLRGPGDATSTARRLIDDALQSCADLLEDFHRAQVECDRLLEDRRAAIAAHKRLFDFMPCACVMTDQHGTILHANTAAGRLLNITNKRLDGRELLLYSHHRDEFLELLGSLPGDDTPISVSLVLRPRERRPIETTAMLMPVAEAERGAWLWFFQASPPQVATTEPLNDAMETAT